MFSKLTFTYPFIRHRHFTGILPIYLFTSYCSKKTLYLKKLTQGVFKFIKGYFLNKFGKIYTSLVLMFVKKQYTSILYDKTSKQHIKDYYNILSLRYFKKCIQPSFKC